MENENVVKEQEPVKTDKKGLMKKGFIAGGIILGLAVAGYKIFGPKKNDSEQTADAGVVGTTDGVTANAEEQPEVTE